MFLEEVVLTSSVRTYYMCLPPLIASNILYLLLFLLVHTPPGSFARIEALFASIRIRINGLLVRFGVPERKENIMKHYPGQKPPR